MKAKKPSTRGTRRLIGPLRRGDLTRFGYTGVSTMSTEKRRAILKKAIAAYGPLSVFRKLNAVYILTRSGSPAASAVFKLDRDWVRTLLH